jgi:hypothetical protein
MLRVWLVVFVASSACVGSMQRAPKQIPADGVVECTDTLEAPIAAAAVAVLSGAATAFAMTHMEWTIEHGGIMWAPALGSLSTSALLGTGLGLSYAEECRVAKRRGAEQAAIVRRKSDARAEAGRLWKRAAAAARADDCATLRELDPEIFALDSEFHAVVFARDVAIARCLASTTARLP